MKDGMTATLELPEYPDRKFDAKIETTSHGIDQKSRTLLVELIADNKDGALFPGAFTRVHFQLPPDPNAVLVPASALIYRDNAIQVGVLGEDNRVNLKNVQIARDLGTEVEITKGLSKDEPDCRQPSRLDRRRRRGPDHGGSDRKAGFVDRTNRRSRPAIPRLTEIGGV